MRRIAIIGCPGSGKSWLAERLGIVAGLPVEHLDDHFWHPDWTPTPVDKWRDVVRDLVSKPEWIIDGHYSGTLDLTVGAAAGVVLLDLSTPVCLYSALQRYGRIVAGDRSLLPKRIRDQEGRPAPGTGVRDFISFIATFRRKRVPDAMNSMARRASTCAVVLHSRRDVRAFIQSAESRGVRQAFEMRRMTLPPSMDLESFGA